MACRVGAIITQSCLFVVENNVFERSSVALTTFSAPSWNNEASPSVQASKIGFHMKCLHFSEQRRQLKRHSWKIAFALNTGGISGNGQQEGLNGESGGLGGTRLGRIVSAGGRQLLQKLNSSRKNVPMKIFLLLLGFYTANALATILGQTGDWDVLVAGVVVAAIEGIGMLMYRKPPSFTSKRFQSFVSMMNYWKAGVCLGLFVDAFKLGS